MGMPTFADELRGVRGSGDYSQARTYLTITVIFYCALFLLNCLRKQFRWTWLKPLAWGCYVSIPTLTSYTIGALGRKFVFHFIWLPFALFGHSGFDNLICFSLQERYDRNVIFFQLTIQVLLLVHYVERKTDRAYRPPFFTLPFLIVIIVACLKVMERVVALAHAAGETEGFSENLRRVINYTNMDEEDHIDPKTMEGFKILVGTRYLKLEDDKIIDGVSLDKIWALLSSRGSNEHLKDTCLSFSFFWLLLGKSYGYPLYEGRSKRKAWKLVREYLLGDRSGHERAFRVIEVELLFLHDYFYTKYFFFYLNGIWWKLVHLLAFVFLAYLAYDVSVIRITALGDNEVIRITALGVNEVIRILPLEVINILISSEVIQIGVFVYSRWFRVILVSYVAKRNRLLTGCIEKVVVAISRISLRSSSILAKLWKRQLNQYTLLESCTSFGLDNKSLPRAVLRVALQIPVPKIGRKLDSRVALSEHVKKVVILSLHSTGPRLSNGVVSLRRNEVENDLSWACKLGKDAEVLLVWHIATSVCEMSHTSRQHRTRSLVDFKVATNLSKYCAYLLAFSPSLLSIPLHEADLTCNTAIRGARKLLNKCSFPCFKTEETNMYERLMEWLRGEGGTGNSTGVLQSGLKLGEQLLTIVEDEERRWKILAELWAEMILFLAPSNSNALVHAEMLADGGEFITVLWALLIHAGVVDRQDLFGRLLLMMKLNLISLVMFRNAKIDHTDLLD